MMGATVSAVKRWGENNQREHCRHDALQGRVPPARRWDRIVAAASLNTCRETTSGSVRVNAGNRLQLTGNPKTRWLLRVDSLGARLAPPALPALSTVPLAAASSVRMLLVRQSASEESV